MKPPVSPTLLLALGSLAAGLWSTNAATPEPNRLPTLAEVKKLFENPPREFASAPLWVWNDDLTEEQIVATMNDLAGQRVRQVFVHPRPGLMTPYLSSDWFRLWKVALREAERLDMNVWIYDENSYPSGFAGGWVPELMPESRGRGLYFDTVGQPPKWSEDLVGIYQAEGEGYQDVSAKAREGGTLPAGKYLVAKIKRANNSPWNGNRCYVDLLYPGVTEKFLEVTLGAYQREIGSQFGKRVPGVFTDEPELLPAGGLAWTPDLPQVFAKRWGYDLLANLPSLQGEVGDWKKVRHNYFQVLSDLFIERWGKPYHDYCETNRLEFTGHYWDHEWPNCKGVPDNMAMYAWHQRPAIDILMNQYQEHTHAQFGNVRIVRELASVANQLGRKRTLCELYGAGGWDLRFEDMKRIADWMGVLGVNTFDEHLSYITIRGARKRDHPQSFSYHEPWWQDYHVMANYLTRLSVAVSQGEQVNRVLVIEPTTTAWMYQMGGPHQGRLKEIGDAFFRLLMKLEQEQYEYDIVSEDVLARHGRPVGNVVNIANQGKRYTQLQVGQRVYDKVYYPRFTENLNQTTVDLLRQTTLGGGWGDARLTSRVDGQLDREAAKTARTPVEDGSAWETILGAELSYDEFVDGFQAHDGFFLKRVPNDGGILFHQRRQLADGQLVFLVNTSLTNRSFGSLGGPWKGIEKWDLNTGRTEKYPFTAVDGKLQARFELPPSGSLLLVLTEAAREPDTLAEQARVLQADAPLQVQRTEPNVLTLDYVDIKAGGESRSNVYFYAAGQFAFQKHGVERNPWDSAVQFKDEIIRRTFPAESGFEATYHFNVEGAVPKDLEIVIERPDLYRIECNGQPVKATPGVWWRDKAFGRIPLNAAARVGGNAVTLKARPFTMRHELESAYLRGSFALKAVDKGFVVVPDTALKAGPWNDQGLPMYADGVAYRTTISIDSLKGRYEVELGKWLGSVARVNVNGKPAGQIWSPPWRCDVTEHLKPGKNDLEVVVIGTLKNTLGPHHGKPGLGTAWPGMFQKGPENGPPPGREYSTVGYGLFEPFVLKQTTTSPGVAAQ